MNGSPTMGFYPTVDSKISLVSGREVAGVVLPEDRQPVDSVTVKTKPQQDAIINNTLLFLHTNPPPYDLYDRNCAELVAAMLRAAGIDLPDVLSPQDLIDALNRMKEEKEECSK